MTKHATRFGHGVALSINAFIRTASERTKVIFYFGMGFPKLQYWFNNQKVVSGYGLVNGALLFYLKYENNMNGQEDSESGLN